MGRYWLETLGCPKNQVDSDKLIGRIEADGYQRAESPSEADLVVVNTCAFIDQARQDSIEAVLDVHAQRPEGSRLVVTGCMAERYGRELEDALPEADLIAPFGVPVSLGPTRKAVSVSPELVEFDLLELPRPAASTPWAYVKVAEGCDRRCGFCAIPQFRGPQRSRSIESILGEVESLGVAEVVLVAQDLASYGRDRSGRKQNLGHDYPIVQLVKQVSEMVERVRLLYLYPSDLNDSLVEAIIDTGVPYFDLSLQHVSQSLLRSMRRFGNSEVFAERIAAIRAKQEDAVFRSNFIVGYPGESEADHDLLLNFLQNVRLDWCGFFPYSQEEGTHAASLPAEVPAGLVSERLSELSELQDAITFEKRSAQIGSYKVVLVDSPGVGRSAAEAPEIDGIVKLPLELPVGQFFKVRIVACEGPDLVATL